ncbi:patatin-like phospholipase family protein [Selenihalanaerobacter shriftii]|uniref:NTE family protein n=1 Tax=Selenihalanaerobacter shriftii TaxID=142842 RepID=A0A1T4NPX1_9FIRM|nr:patatin-like phospholipase family protein [Selenihalanaerobacter shriftii]SJZ81106.1 NTE family protein [Selenihalanaerobacter shriftii]
MLGRKAVNRPTIGLALGGGGLRGIVHIGILEVLSKEGIQIDMISGSSMGGLIAGLYGAGLEPSDLDKLALEVKDGKRFDLSLGFIEIIKFLIKSISAKLGPSPKEMPMGLISGNKIKKDLLKETEGKYFNEARIPIAITATNIMSGELVIFIANEFKPDLQHLDDRIFITDQQIATAIRATISIPGLFIPLEVEGHLLVDGGLKNNVPADILDELGVDIKVAIDLGFAIQDDKLIKNPVDLILQSVDIMGQEVSNLILEDYADLIIEPKVEKASLTDIEKIPYLLKTGRQIGYQLVPKIERLIKGGK